VYGVALAFDTRTGVGEFDFKIVSFGPHADSATDAATNRANMTDRWLIVVIIILIFVIGVNVMLGRVLLLLV
jgi:hypothetical protein